MLRLLKQLRSNKLKSHQYIKYAIGEILLVMVGILLAVQVNNLNESRKNRKEERLILKGILKEFESNKKELEITILRNTEIADALEIMYGPTGKKWDGSLTRKASDSLSLNMTGYVLPAIGTAYLDDILTTGKILIIQNKDLQYELAKWPKELDDHANETEALVGNFMNQQSIPFMIKHYAMNVGRISKYFQESSGFDLDYRAVYQMPEFENLILFRANMAFYANEENQILLDETNKIISLIQIELKE